MNQIQVSVEFRIITDLQSWIRIRIPVLLLETRQNVYFNFIIEVE